MESKLLSEIPEFSPEQVATLKVQSVITSEDFIRHVYFCPTLRSISEDLGISIFNLGPLVDAAIGVTPAAIVQEIKDKAQRTAAWFGQ